MTYLSHWDGVPMVSALVCMVTLWTWPMMNHEIRLSDCHDSPSYNVARALNLERILSLCENWQEALANGWDLNVVIYLYELGHYW